MSCFIYYGHFYRLTIDGHVSYCCRSTLEIVRSRSQIAREADQDSGRLLDLQPNAVFVMLNPGSSRPCDGQEPDDSIDPCEIDGHASSNLVLTCPDDTQQAVEKVMTCKQFDHVRVLNLFDIRERCSAMLINRIRTSLGLDPRRHLPRQPEIKPYSIFSCERRHELRNRLSARSRIVIAAWGADKATRPFFRQCYQILEGIGLNLQIHGWPKGQPREDRGFCHPSRRRKKWPRFIINNWPDEQGAPCQGQSAD